MRVLVDTGALPGVTSAERDPLGLTALLAVAVAVAGKCSLDCCVSVGRLVEPQQQPQQQPALLQDRAGFDTEKQKFSEGVLPTNIKNTPSEHGAGAADAFLPDDAPQQVCDLQYPSPPSNATALVESIFA